jgi:hypothetical protein
VRGALAGLVAGALVCGACARSSPARAAPAPALAPAPAPVLAAPAALPRGPVTLAVPRAPGPIKIDAELDGKKVWEADVGNTQNFKDTAGMGMVPYTEAKARWDDKRLYLLLYAGDLDLEGTVRAHDGEVERDDAFHIEFGSGDEVRVVSVSVLGTVADALCRSTPAGRSCDPRWESHARVAVDRDGSMNKIGDNDEEWVVEMALPFSALGVSAPRAGTRLPFSIRRCEVGHAAHRACGSWGVNPTGELVLGR